jgi:hypothetical protein
MKSNRVLLFCVGLCLLAAGIEAPAQTVRKMPGRVKYANIPPLTGPQQKEFSEIAAMISQGQDRSRINERWGRFVSEVAKNQDGQVNIDALVNEVMRQATLGNEDDVRNAKEKAGHYNSVKKTLQEEISSSRHAMAEMEKGKQVTVRPKRIEYRPERVAAKPVTAGTQSATVRRTDAAVTLKPITTAPELKTYISDLEGKLQSTGDDAQLAQIDLQNALQNQQQALQTMSNVSKMLHDTAMAVIRKIG